MVQHMDAQTEVIKRIRKYLGPIVLGPIHFFYLYTEEGVRK